MRIQQRDVSGSQAHQDISWPGTSSLQAWQAVVAQQQHIGPGPYLADHYVIFDFSLVRRQVLVWCL
jgi:hypothetical protein